MEHSVIQTQRANLSYKATRERFSEYQLHCHGFYELYYFTGGNVRYMVEGTHFTPAASSLILLKPGVVHGVRNTSRELYSRYTFHFTSAIIPAEHRELLLRPFHQDTIYFEGIKLQGAMDTVLESAGLPETLQETAVCCRFQALLTQLFPLMEQNDRAFAGLTKEITEYINEHLRQPLGLQQIAKEFFISKSQLSRIFKRDLDMTIGAYIGLKRSAMAKQLMLKGCTAQEAACTCGFQDYSTFFRTFKRCMGYAPTQGQAFNSVGLEV